MVHVDLKRSENMFLQHPFTICTDYANILNFEPNELINYTLRFNTLYSRSTCYYLCFFLDFATKNNFSFNNLFFHDDVNDDMSLLNIDDEQLISERSAFDYEEMCSWRCPLECNEVNFEIRTNTRNDLEQTNNKSFRMVIGYQSLMYKKVTQIPETSLSDLISKIGGTLGKTRVLLF